MHEVPCSMHLVGARILKKQHRAWCWLLFFSPPFVSDSVRILDCSMPGLSIISQSLPKFMSIASVMPFSHLNLWHPLLLLPSIFPSIRDFSNDSAVHIRWPKYRSFSISPSMSIQGWFSLRLTGLISFLLKGLSGVFSSTTVPTD